MDMALENLPKKGLIALLQQKDAAIKNHQQEIAHLQYQVELYKRMQFGQKRERFEADPAQGVLPFEAAPQEEARQEAEIKQQITYTRKKQSTHKGRAALPAHLPVEEIEIHPEGDLTQMVCIGKDVTEELECEPARFFIRRYIRYKYAAKNGESVKTAALPERVIDKGIPGAGLLSMVLTDKYMDHLPLYRQKQRFARESIPIASSTLEGWVKQGLERLEPLFQQLKFDLKAKGYLQVDETGIKVLESDQKGACHQGYYWVYHSPLDGLVVMDYQPTRGAVATKEMLAGFSGYLQSDGYVVYEKIGKRAEVTPVACWAHARREFERALDNDKVRAGKALALIQQLYAAERKAKEAQMTPDETKKLRLDESLPVINELGKWVFAEVKNTLPKSQIGKAMRYAMERWDKLSAYLQDGNLHIDNNAIENAIRPIALGRKNYLFAGTHEAAARAGMIYSFFAMCKKQDVNPFQWLK
ncbi:MAG: IS66 family transposase, partial [Bacteroidota bacterium]|nr:IS66 family transposase [Bacteroidota bacterium]